MNILSDLKNDLRELILPAIGREVPLAVTQVIEALWSDERRPQVSRKKKTDLGWEFHFSLPAGISFRDFANRQEYFRDAIGVANVEMVRAGKMAVMRVITQQLKSRYLYDWNYSKEGGDLVIPIGYTHRGLITVPLETCPHILIGGITGGGKSNALHVIINSLIWLDVPPQIIVIDLKKSEYNYLENHIQMLVTEHEEAAKVLQRLIGEMRKRQNIFKAAKTVNIQKYNAKYDPLPYVVLVIDELAELTDEDSQDDVETLLRLCRSSGICIIAATQRPDANTFKKFGQSKANFRGRLCFQVADAINSKIILDNSMGADLPDTPGRAIWKLGKDCVEVQTPYLDPEEAEKRLEGI